MFHLDAFSAENSVVIGTKEVFNSLWMFFAQFVVQTCFVIIFKVKLCLSKHGIFLYYLIQNVDVKRESFGGFKIFNQSSANWTTNSVLMMQLLDTARAKGMPTVD